MLSILALTISSSTMQSPLMPNIIMEFKWTGSCRIKVVELDTSVFPLTLSITVNNFKRRISLDLQINILYFNCKIFTRNAFSITYSSMVPGDLSENL